MVPTTAQERGNALILSLVLAFVLAGLAASTLSIVVSANKEQQQYVASLNQLCLAEAGLWAAVDDLAQTGTGTLGSATNPQPFGNGAFFTTAVDNLDETFTVTSTGLGGDGSRTVRGVVRRSGDVFSHAIFAGNSSGDPNYQMDFGGTGASADEINGDLYSGGHVVVTDDAVISGSVRAGGTITGVGGQENVHQPVPDIDRMEYEVNNDVNVAVEFSAHEQWLSDDAGGSAWQLPEDIPSHIFRKNPNDRTTEIDGTVKDDYFLEDPYEYVGLDSQWDGTDPYNITLTGAGKPGPDTNNMVFFIDGNLWLNNRSTYSFKMVSNDGSPLSVTLVVKGNIYVSDNLFYGDPDADGVALIAIQDDQVADSGNIYFGDPTGGTLETMYAFMYAENNFEDNNLDSSGSDTVIVNGTMSAGNHVSIQRDFATQHSKFIMNYDDRLAQESLLLPGLPTAPGQVRHDIVMWTEAATPQSVQGY